MLVSRLPWPGSQAGSHVSMGWSSVCHWGTCWQSLSFWTFTEWTSGTFPPAEPGQIVRVRGFTWFCSFPLFYLQSTVWNGASWYHILCCLTSVVVIHNLWIYIPQILKNHIRGPMMAFGAPKGGALCIWESKITAVCLEQRRARAGVETHTHLSPLADLCSPSEGTLWMFFPFGFVCIRFVFIKSPLKTGFCVCVCREDGEVVREDSYLVWGPVSME